MVVRLAHSHHVRDPQPACEPFQGHLSCMHHAEDAVGQAHSYFIGARLKFVFFLSKDLIRPTPLKFLNFQ